MKCKNCKKEHKLPNYMRAFNKVVCDKCRYNLLYNKAEPEENKFIYKDKN